MVSQQLQKTVQRADALVVDEGPLFGRLARIEVDGIVAVEGGGVSVFFWDGVKSVLSGKC